MYRKNKFWFVISMLVALSLVIAACGGGATTAPTEAPPPPPTEAPAATESPAEPPAEMPEVGFAYFPGGFLEQAINGDFAGTEVTVDGPFTNPDDLRFFKSVAPFEEATGIDVQYTGTKEFEALINTQVDAGSPPDIANISQPGLLASFARQGQVVDVTEFIPVEHLQNNYAQGWLDMSTMPGPDGDDIQAGVWHRSAGKSFVWYPKAKFDEAGYEVPTTWEELLALTQQIADDGDPAWCIGIESGAATGWVATDWIENIMLRTTSLELRQMGGRRTALLLARGEERGRDHVRDLAESRLRVRRHRQHRLHLHRRFARAHVR